MLCVVLSGLLYGFLGYFGMTLVKEGFSGVIYSTKETRDLAELILEDALGLLNKQAVREGVLPLYEAQDMKRAFTLWKTIPYHENISFDIFSVYAKDAGHILGSSMFEFTHNGKKIVFTGDLGNSPSPLLCDTEVVNDADYIIMESVYGDRNHEPKVERREKFQRIIEESIKRGGTLIIPTFSLERTQVILYEINNLVESKSILSVPIYLDSPLATKVTEVYKASSYLFNEKVREEIKAGDDVFNFPRLSYTVNAEESKSIDYSVSPKIIIAGSGMSVGGRVIHHEELYLPDSKNTILLVGYQTPGSLGRDFLYGLKKVNIHNSEVAVRAKIEYIPGYSSHKDSDHLVEFVSNTKDTIKKAFIVMGEMKSSTFLAQRIRDEIGIEAICPNREGSFLLFS